jgi:hypothetical protein
VDGLKAFLFAMQLLEIPILGMQDKFGSGQFKLMGKP